MQADGIPVHDERGELLPDVDDAITRTVTAAVWFGVTIGYLTLANSYHIPADSWCKGQRKVAAWSF